MAQFNEKNYVKIICNLTASPEDFIIVAAGGKAGVFSAFVPGWSGKRSSQSVTKEIRKK